MTEAFRTEGQAHDSASSILTVRQVNKKFGGVLALSQVDFKLAPNKVTSMIGPNGAGKSTFINVVSGVYAPDNGKVFFQEKDITGAGAHMIARTGVGRTFQLVELFQSMTVLENAMVGCHTQSRSGMFRCGLKLPSANKEEKQLTEAALANLDLVGLAHRAGESISNLPLGERKLVGIARALGMQPKVLMLDEPAGGLAAHEVDKLIATIRTLLDRGISLFVVEHNMPFVMSISDKVVALDMGQKIAEGSPESVRSDPRVIKAYLGEEIPA